MTGRDLMPIGKYKGMPLDQVPVSFKAWFVQQDWSEEKYPDLYAFFKSGGKTPANDAAIFEDEARIMNSMSTTFQNWWRCAYGERLRKASGDLYITHLRIAREAWAAADKAMTPHGQQIAAQRAYVPPPKPAPDRNTVSLDVAPFTDDAPDDAPARPHFEQRPTPINLDTDDDENVPF